MTSAPVFVDATGRRARLVVAACWVLATVFGGYVVLVALTLVLPTGALSLDVPGLGPVLPKTSAPRLTTDDGGRPPVAVLTPLPLPSATGAPGPTPTGSRTTGPRAPRATQPASRPTGGPVVTSRPSARPSPRPTPRPTASPTPAHGNGKPATHPTPGPRPSKSPPPHP